MNNQNQQQQIRQAFDMEGFYEFDGVENFNPKLTFIRKTYSAFSIQLLVILAIFYILKDLVGTDLCCPPYYNFSINAGIFVAPGFFLFTGCIMVFSCTFLLRKRTKSCIVFLFIRAVCVAVYFYSRAVVSSDNEPAISLFCFLALQLTLTLYSYLRKREFSYLLAFLCVIGWAAITVVLLCELGNYEVGNAISLVLPVFLYGIYIVLDTLFLLSISHYNLDIQEHLFGSTVLFFDVTIIGVIFIPCVALDNYIKKKFNSR